MAYRVVHPEHGAVMFTRTPEEVLAIEMKKDYAKLKEDNEALSKKYEELEKKIMRMTEGE